MEESEAEFRAETQETLESMKETPLEEYKEDMGRKIQIRFI